jgi:hypothetical protein
VHTLYKFAFTFSTIRQGTCSCEGSILACIGPHLPKKLSGGLSIGSGQAQRAPHRCISLCFTEFTNRLTTGMLAYFGLPFTLFLRHVRGLNVMHFYRTWPFIVCTYNSPDVIFTPWVKFKPKLYAKILHQCVISSIWVKPIKLDWVLSLECTISLISGHMFINDKWLLGPWINYFILYL